MDRGIATQERVQWLRDNGYRYLVVSRERIRQFDPDAAQRIGRPAPRRAPAQGPRGAPVLLLRGTRRQGTRHRRAFRPAFRDRPDRTVRRIVPTAHPQTRRPGLGTYRSAQGEKPTRRPAYDIELDTDPSAERATAVRFTRRPVEGSMMTHPGVYCLRSNQTDWDEETLWRTYVTPHRPRGRVPLAKSELGHSTTSPSAPKDICSSPSSPTSSCSSSDDGCAKPASTRAGTPGILEGQQRIKTFRRADGRTLHVRKATRAEPPQQAIYDALGIDPAPGATSIV